MSAFTLILLVLAPAQAAADDRNLAERQQPIDIPRATSTITVDAVLDEPAWQSARRTTLDFETWPAENIPARASTEAFITYDAEQLYVAFIAHDPDPSKIRARLSDRDAMFQDDFVGVVLDTFNDQRRGFKFFSNPLGVQGDLFHDDIRQSEDSSYDAIWESAGRITDEGYIVEMAIPFRSLRFRNGGEAQVWGVEFLRVWPRDERRQFRAYRADRDLACYLCEFQKYRGFEGADAGNNIEITPTVTGVHTRARPEYGAAMPDAETDVEPGLDFRWGITPNVIFNATLNPDFSQVEADSAQLDVNNQFALYFPERRPFFLEGQDLFDDVFGLVYTRNIADPDYGAKVTGKEGDHAFGAFVTDDQLTNLIFPGPQGDDFESYDFESRNAAARYRYDLGPNSAIGALATTREGGDYRNSVYAVDGLYRFTPSDKLTAEFASSQTVYPDYVAAEFEQPTTSFSDEAWHISYDRDVREYFLYADHNNVGEGFRADLGFVPQVGYEKTLLGGGYQWHGEEEDWYRRLKLNGDYDFTFDSDGQELERELEAYFSFNGGMQSYLEIGGIRRRQFYDGVTYYQTLASLYGEMKPNGSVSVGGYFRTGDAIDYANSRAGRQLLLDPWMQLRLGRHLFVSIDPTWERLEVQGGTTLYTAKLLELRTTWQFNTRMSVRWITQWRDVTRDPSLYIDTVDERSREWGNQLLFAYKVNPRTLFYAGFSDGQEAVDGDPLEIQQQTAFIKLSYAWQR